LIKSAQEAYFDENNAYYPTATSTNSISAINTNLKIGITADVLTYSCTADAANNYSCDASYDDWTCTVTKSTEPSCTP
jgi:hypothetical protein